jgi:hypothetical protein
VSILESVTLAVDLQRYERWEEIRVTGEIDRMATDSTSQCPNASWHRLGSPGQAR